MMMLIDIPKDYYEHIKRAVQEGHNCKLYDLIANGTLITITCLLNFITNKENEKCAYLLTYEEQIIFLKAIDRERKICKFIDASNKDAQISLVQVCNSIERKVKKIMFESEDSYK